MYLLYARNCSAHFRLIHAKDKAVLPLGTYISAGDKINNKIINKEILLMLGGVKLKKRSRSHLKRRLAYSSKGDLLGFCQTKTLRKSKALKAYNFKQDDQSREGDI